MKDYSFQFYFKEIICDIKEITFSISEKKLRYFWGLEEKLFMAMLDQVLFNT